jgi:integration host factor subunit alpha
LNNKFKKIDLVKNLKSATGFSLNFSKKIINDLLEIITKNIKIGNLNIKNVGSFKIIHKKERLGRNPKTKEEFIITSRKSISFTASKKIFKNLN